MDAPYYNGDDNRDELTQPDEPPCPDENCRATWDQPCTPECQCHYCLRRRKLAAEAAGITSGDAA